MAIIFRRLRFKCPPLWKVFPIALTIMLFTSTGLSTIKYNPKSPTALIITLLCLCFYLYFRIILVGPGTPKTEYYKITPNVEDLENEITLRSKDFKISKFNHCEKCTFKSTQNNNDSANINHPDYLYFLKPERTHHCSTCKTCVLKMDHHCPWFACCIGFKNHKSFIQFLLLTTLYSLVILIVNFLEVKSEIQKNFSSDLEGDDTNYLQFKFCHLVFISTIFFLTLVVFDGYSIYLLINNMTTIEKMEFEDAQEREKILLLEEGDGNNYNKMNIYDLGSKMINWRQVMGKHWYQWFLFNTDEGSDNCNYGFLFPVNKDVILQQRLIERLGVK